MSASKTVYIHDLEGSPGWVALISANAASAHP